MEETLLHKFQNFIFNIVQGAKLLFDISLLERSRARALAIIGDEMIRDPSLTGLGGPVHDVIKEIKLLNSKIQEHERTLSHMFRRSDTNLPFDWV